MFDAIDTIVSKNKQISHTHTKTISNGSGEVTIGIGGILLNENAKWKHLGFQTNCYLIATTKTSFCHKTKYILNQEELPHFFIIFHYWPDESEWLSGESYSC